MIFVAMFFFIVIVGGFNKSCQKSQQAALQRQANKAIIELARRQR